MQEPLIYHGITGVGGQNIGIAIHLAVQITAVPIRSQQQGFESIGRTERTL